MTKIAVAFVLAAFVCVTKVYADDDFPSLQDQQQSDDLSIPTFAPITFPTFTPIPVITAEDIAKLKPKNGEVVKGTSTSTYSTSKTVNGVPVQQESGGRVVKNDDGAVQDTSYKN